MLRVKLPLSISFTYKIGVFFQFLRSHFLLKVFTQNVNGLISRFFLDNTFLYYINFLLIRCILLRLLMAFFYGIKMNRERKIGRFLQFFGGGRYNETSYVCFILVTTIKVILFRGYPDFSAIETIFMRF